MAKSTGKTVHPTIGGKSIQRYWSLGNEGLADWRKRNRGVEDGAVRMDDHLETLAKKSGLKPAQYATAMRIARLYADEQIREVLSLIAKRRSKFGTSHLTRLLAVTSPKSRMRLTKQAIREGWSFRKIDRAVKDNHSQRSYGGRRPAQASDSADALSRLLQASMRWERLYDSVREGLPESTRKPTQAIVANINELRRKTQLWSKGPQFNTISR
jgi:hypothetical protein